MKRTLKSKKKKAFPKFDLAQKCAIDEFFGNGFKALEAGEIEASIEYFILSLERTPSPEAHTFLAKSLYRTGEIDVAIEECRQALKLNPKFGIALNDLGAYLMQKRRFNEAEKVLNKAVKSKDVAHQEIPHFNLARFYLNKGMLIRASKELHEAIRINPAFAPAKDFLVRIESQLH